MRWALASVAVVAACPQPHATPAYTARVTRALAAREDVWGNELLRAPTLARARGYLAPLLYAKTSRGRKLTDSGVYYLAFGVPGTPGAQLHVADGGEILARRADGPRIAIRVRGERFGSCLARLSPARLAGGWLPILETRYRDAHGTRYAQESFAWRVGGRLTSFVRVTADRPATVRIGTLTARAPVLVTWRRGRPQRIDEAAYDAARSELAAYWRRRLDDGAAFVVPERAVLDAERNLLVQNLTMTWRYSLGNPYEEFSFPESVDAAQVMAEYGFGPVARAMLLASLPRRPTPYPNWKIGEKLLGSALYVRLSGDRAYLAEVTPVLSRYVAKLTAALLPQGLLNRERYSSDIPDSVYGLHSQAVVWQGLRGIAAVWAGNGGASLAARARALAARLEAGLRRAVRASERRLPDGSLFVPVRLLDDEPAYDSLTQSRAGSYWNLVAPYAFASGLFAPGSPEAVGVLRYLERHGSRLLGLVRAGAYALYRNPIFPVSGTDEVYGLNLARFLADNDQTDQLVLSLYGQLAAAMTPNTFVSGEGATVAPLDGARYRAMYLPPNSVSNASFLETLRLLLVHETPAGLELAYATPRAWLARGKRIEVRDAPTSFGRVSYTLDAAAHEVRASLHVPQARTLRLRVRLPLGERITSVLVDDRAYRRFDARTQTIDLDGKSGDLALVVRYAGG